MSTVLYRPAAPSPALSHEIFQRSALLIAQRGWCQGQGLLYVGSPHDPQAASLVGALSWAATGNAQSCTEAVRSALATVRTRLDPDGNAPFNDWELLCAWNDTPARTREQAITLLLSCRQPAAHPMTNRPVPLPG
ncbi:hypothetical protein ACIBVL_40770 [Streptomyces sp. NPDC049687]|uniref:DUF6197 family protein n=1 Tax=Streptomyces sp. NPDC049687 TaxID=3365596 RepID=UPI00378A86A2